MIITLGIVYGDIGTSPLYTMNALILDAGGVKNLTRPYILGCLSLIFWTLILITTIKYVLIALRAQNHGEGGIFSLYALVRKKKKWLIIPALIGGAALLADGTLTPAVTVTTAIEGLKGMHFGKFVLITNQQTVLLCTITILIILFLIQRFGTSFLGKIFGLVMILWFSFIAFFGLYHLKNDWSILQALSPLYAIEVLFSPHNKVGIFILGSIFLATTGAEALYSDMGHVGRKNIYLTWPLVFIALILNYFGQGAFLLNNLDQTSKIINFNPFFNMLPANFHLVGVILATLAAIIASQALISGSFTLVEEAIGLKILPKMRIEHPNLLKGQVYIAKINYLLCFITIMIVLYFKNSHHMEAAYGLAITLTMLMTTVLLYAYLVDFVPKILALLTVLFFGLIEIIFLIASLVKFMHGGFVTVIITFIIILVMIIWYYGNQIKTSLLDESENISLLDYKDQLQKLANDESIPLYMSNLVMLAKVKKDYSIKREILYSILDKKPKRAKVYWFVTINTTNEPYTNYYTVDMMNTRNIVNLQL